jgi:hypothetical protein
MKAEDCALRSDLGKTLARLIASVTRAAPVLPQLIWEGKSIHARLQGPSIEPRKAYDISGDGWTTEIARKLIVT